MNNIQFIFDVEETKHTDWECYVAYDFTQNEVVRDIKLNKTHTGNLLSEG